MQARAPRKVTVANWALAFVAVGDYDEALKRLDAAMQMPAAINYTALVMLKANEWNDPVLGERRFREALNELWP